MLLQTAHVVDLEAGRRKSVAAGPHYGRPAATAFGRSLRFGRFRWQDDGKVELDRAERTCSARSAGSRRLEPVRKDARLKAERVPWNKTST